MIRRNGIRLVLVAAFLAALTLALPISAASTQNVKIGMTPSIFHGVPSVLVNIALQPFSALIRYHTGMNGTVVIGKDSQDVAKKLNDRKLELGVFQGYEFAWAQKRYPDLVPLMIAVNRDPNLRAKIVVRNDSKVASLADLKGQKIGLARRTKGHCRVFLQRGCVLCSECEPSKFCTMTTLSNVELTLDQVCTGEVQAGLVDADELQTYGDIKPGCLARLKTIEVSQVFPAGVIAYRKGTLSQSTLDRFRQGMLNANKTARGRDLMQMVKITSFRTVPTNYSQLLSDVVKNFPEPEQTK